MNCPNCGKDVDNIETHNAQMHEALESLYSSEADKTYTCDKCGKVGDDFSTMAQEICPADSGAGHQIPILGDRKKSGEGDMEDNEDQMAMADGQADLEDNWDDIPDEYKESYAKEEGLMDGKYYDKCEQCGDIRWAHQNMMVPPPRGVDHEFIGNKENMPSFGEAYAREVYCANCDEDQEAETRFDGVKVCSNCGYSGEDEKGLESRATEDGMYSNFGTKDKDNSWSVMTVASDLIYFNSEQEAKDYTKNFPAGSYDIHAPKVGEAFWDIDSSYGVKTKEELQTQRINIRHFLDSSSDPEARQAYQLKLDDITNEIASLGDAQLGQTANDSDKYPYFDPFTESYTVKVKDESGSTSWQQSYDNLEDAEKARKQHEGDHGYAVSITDDTLGEANFGKQMTKKPDGTWEATSEDDDETVMTEADYDPEHQYDETQWKHNEDGHITDLGKDKEQFDALMAKLDESWDFRTNDARWTAFEKIGFKSDEAIIMANLQVSDLSTEVKRRIVEVEEEEKAEKREDSKDAFNDEGSQPDTEVEQEIDYNQVFENTLQRSKYECEHCNSGYKSNEALMTHFNDVHATRSDGDGCLYCNEAVSPKEMIHHLAYEHSLIHEGTDDYEVDVDEYTKTGEPVQKQPDDERTYNETMPYDDVCETCGASTNHKEGGKCADCKKGEAGENEYDGELGKDWKLDEDAEQEREMSKSDDDYDGFYELTGQQKSEGEVLKKKSNETTIDNCIHCGRSAQDHANPNTDYRGMRGDAPATDHYYEALDDGVE